ncbi:hypothetical protein [Asticcacaulis sp.]|uniref:hypothetical protein n=1 Tax=Asticcacaulis sp. TaxID=1872648 RepID=UPI002BB3F17F|nr:hypothetical protein [Asticcacaulis sp.]HTM80195.1 hypothetical protein [Asticcacaulis sp.]
MFDFVLAGLAEEITTAKIIITHPIPCDRWIARSALQKAIRRGEADIALAALATLFEAVGEGIWRHLTVIALEDIGAAGIDTVARVVAAGRNRKWRALLGGDWRAASVLVCQMAAERHCQAACDLLMRLTNDPLREGSRIAAMDRNPADLVDIIRDGDAELMERAEAALALGGGLAEEQPLHQAAAVFRALEGIGFSSHVFVTCQAAWRLCRNPMALLLPFIWLEWMKEREVPSTDDLIPETKMIDQVPAYAIDQFTRVGGQVARAFLVRNPALLAMMDSRRIHSASRARIVGDLIFLNEGGLVVNRPIWQTADRLRLPHRPLPATFVLREKLNEVLKYMARKASDIEFLRRQNLFQANQ